MYLFQKRTLFPHSFDAFWQNNTWWFQYELKLLFFWQTVLMEINEWLDAHPKEVVILSFSHFLGLSQELHVQLITTIRSIFSAKLCPEMVRLVRFIKSVFLIF